MKKLSIEEKAKRYDEALKVLHKYDGANIMFSQDLKEEMFPELKESEDERIRKALLGMVHDTTGDSLWVDYNVHKEDAIAWLEKQSEHANFLSKIQIGDKVTRNKDGVLVNLSQLKRIAKPAEEHNITGIGSKSAQGKLGEMIKNLKPVNEVLEHESAWSEKYIADVFEKVGLAKIAREQSNDSLTNALQDAMIELSKFLPQQNLAWSEEDKKIWEEISDMLWEGYRQSCSKLTWDNIRDWIKPKIEYFKDSSQPKQEWNEEDEQTFIKSVEALEDSYNFMFADWLKEHKNQLLRPQSTWKPSDEQMLAINTAINVLGKGTINGKYLIKLQEQLKKLREK